jgi:cytochrome o ubiquinol oxidase operon protein cyoD
MGHVAYQNWNTSIKRLSLGLVCSLILLGSMYTLVNTQALPRPFLNYTIMGLAFLQALVQLVCFLHLGSETSPFWNTLLFLFMLAIMLIVVVGSVYIMYNLNYHMM